MLLVMVSWAIFAMEDFSRLGAYLRVMFGLGGAPLADSAFGYYFRSYLPVLAAAAVASTPLASRALAEAAPAGRAGCLGTLAMLAGLTLCTGLSGGRGPTTPSSISVSKEVSAMSKQYSIFLTALFCAFLGGMALAESAAARARASPSMENRYLQKAPTLSFSSVVVNGKFMEEAEDYVSDHIAGRDFWVALKAWSERLSGKQRERRASTLAGQDTLLNQVADPDEKQLSQAMDYLNAPDGAVRGAGLFRCYPQLLRHLGTTACPRALPRRTRRASSGT